MRLINADNLVAHKVQGEIGNLSGDFVPGFCIDREPTVDAVPVIRCKDCAHQRPSPFGVTNLCWCIIAGRHRGPNYYCADADPKEGK